MKQILFATAILLLGSSFANSQELVKHAPAGFDSMRAGIPQGNIDTITYASRTVGATRKSRGKEEIAYNNCKIMLSKFDEMNIKYQYSEYPGGHTWPVWRNNLYNFAQELFK